MGVDCAEGLWFMVKVKLGRKKIDNKKHHPEGGTKRQRKRKNRKATQKGKDKLA